MTPDEEMKIIHKVLEEQYEHFMNKAKEANCIPEPMKELTPEEIKELSEKHKDYINRMCVELDRLSDIFPELKK